MHAVGDITLSEGNECSEDQPHLNKSSRVLVEQVDFDLPHNTLQDTLTTNNLKGKIICTVHFFTVLSASEVTRQN